MKTYQVLITTTFEQIVEVDADSEEEAKQIVDNSIADGAYDTIDCEPNTEIEII